MSVGVAVVIASFCLISYVSVVGEALHNYALSRLFELIPEADQARQRRFEKLCARDDEFTQVVEIARIIGFVAHYSGWCLVLVSAGGGLDLIDLAYAAILSVISLVLCVLIIPPLLLRHRDEAALLVLLPTFAWLALPFRPLTAISSSVRRIGARIEGVQVAEGAQETFEEDLADSLEEAEREGVLGEEEREMIHNVVELAKTPASRAMIPRTDMVCVDIAEGLGAALKVGADTGYTRIPVYENDRDHIIGVLHVTDLLPTVAEGKAPADLRAVLRPARFWPENKPLDELLQEMREEKLKFGVLLDEHGGTSGLITIEDVLERIVGRLPGEHDTRAMPKLPDNAIRPFVDDEAEADADVDLDELNEKLQIELPEAPEYNSIGGLMLHQLGRLPARGEAIDVAGFKLTVIDADERRIKRVRIARLSAATDVSER